MNRTQPLFPSLHLLLPGVSTSSFPPRRGVHSPRTGPTFVGAVCVWACCERETFRVLLLLTPTWTLRTPQHMNRRTFELRGSVEKPPPTCSHISVSPCCGLGVSPHAYRAIRLHDKQLAGEVIGSRQGLCQDCQQRLTRDICRHAESCTLWGLHRDGRRVIDAPNATNDVTLTLVHLD